MNKLNSFNNTKVCYYFCTRNFYNKLLKECVIRPSIHFDSVNYCRRFAYKYLNDRLNQPNGFFFVWLNKINPYDNPYKEDDDGDYVLLELEVPDEYVIDTNYYNWCDLMFPLISDNDNETYEEALEKSTELILGTFGEKETLEHLYELVFDLSDSEAVHQGLLKELKKEWIKNVKFVENKII